MSGNVRIKCREVSFVGERRVLRSDVAQQREGSVSVVSERNDPLSGLSSRRKSAGTGLKRFVEEEAAISTDQHLNISDAVEENQELGIGNSNGEAGTRENNDIDEAAPGIDEAAPGAVDENGKNNGPQQVNCEEEMEGDKKGETQLDVGRQKREEADVDAQEVTQEAGVERPNDKENDGPVNGLHGNGTEPIKSDDKTENVKKKTKKTKKRCRPACPTKRKEEHKNKDVLVGNKRTTRSSCVAKPREYDSSNGNNITIGGNNHRELTAYEESETEEKLRSNVAKKRKASDTLKKKSTGSGLPIKRHSEALENETTENKFKEQPSISSGDQAGDGESEKKMRTNSKKINGLETAKIKQINHSGQGTHKRLGGVLKELSRNKKTGRFEKFSSHREDEESKRISRLPSNCTQNASECSSLHGGRKNVKSTSSAVSLEKVKVVMEKITSAQKKVSRELKRGCKQNNLDSSNDKSLVVVKGQSSSTSETPFPTGKIEVATGAGRNIAKQKIRDQITNMLLDANWKIDKRPRKGTSYVDTVYISPQGSGYWSITKAYDVFLNQLNRADGTEVTHSFGKSSKTTKRHHHKFRTGSLFSTIPAEALGILKKVIMKRRSKMEIEKAKGKVEDGRSKKAKGTTSIKHPTSKHPKDKGRVFKERKRNNVNSHERGTICKGSLLETGREKQRGIALLARGFNQVTKAGTDVYVPYVFRRTIFSWLIDLGVMPASGKVKYMNQKRTRVMLEGWITRNGIHCSCCCKIITVSMFEVHAGSELHQPYQNIYLEGGISLLQCQLNAWDKQDESVCRSFYSVDTDGDDRNDDTCGICGDGGDLICCDGCPSTFHQSCLGIKRLPPGDWHCMNCLCKFCNLEASSDVQEKYVTDSPLFSCSQCEEKYHQKCVPEEDAIPLSSNLPNSSFCSHSCKKLFERLQKLLGVKNDLEAGFSLTLLQRFDELPDSVYQLDHRVECNSKIAVALAVMDECFVPIIDQRSGINVINNVVYNCGSNFSRLDYRGFYTYILERGDEIISVANLRIHGTRLAEMPFIGTRNMYRRQGMCRRLLNGIESALCSFDIEKLVIPAISDLVDTWTNVFGFKTIEDPHKEEISSVNMLVFPGTGLLFKPLQKKDSSKRCFGVEKFEMDSKYNRTSDIAKETFACSFLGLEPNASDEVIAQCEHEDNKTGPDYTEESPDTCDSPHVSKSRALECQLTKDSNNQNLLLNSEVIYHVEPTIDNIVASSSGTETKLPSESNLHSNIKVIANGILAENSCETKCNSTEDSTSTLQDSVPDTGTNPCVVDGTLLPQLDEVHCTSQSTIASTLVGDGGNDLHNPVSSERLSLDASQSTNAFTLGGSGGNDLHIPVSSERLISDASRHNGSDIASRTTAVCPITHDFQTFTECLVDNQNVKHQVGTLEPNFNAHLEFGNSQAASGRLEAVTNNSVKTIEHTDRAVGEGIVHGVLQLKGRPADVDDEDTERCVSEVIKTSVYDARGKEC